MIIEEKSKDNKELRIIFSNSRGDKLVGILSGLTNDNNQPVIILVHGFSTSKNTKSLVLIRQLLEEKKIAVFRIDIYGHGESEGKLENVTVSEGIDDILQAIEYLKNTGYKKIGLVGSSFGGLCSIIASARTHDLLFLALKSPVSNYREFYQKTMSQDELRSWKEKGYSYRGDDEKKLRINYKFYEDFKNNNGYEFAPKIKIPVLIVHGDKDTVVPITQSNKTTKLIPNCKLFIIKDADHRYTNPNHMREMSKAITNFIFQQLQNE